MDIYVDINYFNQNKTYDLWVDENALVREILMELSMYLDFNSEDAVLVSKNKRGVIDNAENLLNQGIEGGDTFILIVKEGENIGTNDFV